MTPDLSPEEKAAVFSALRQLIEADRFQFSDRIKTLKAALAKLDPSYHPAPWRKPAPPPLPAVPPGQTPSAAADKASVLASRKRTRRALRDKLDGG